MDDKLTLLKKYFGYSSFRDGQERLIDAILSGRDAFAVMPTGGGKSLCFQLPALLLPGVTLVISPLISLMKDQVMSLSALGVPAAYINSSQSPGETDEVYAGLHRRRYKLLYVAPERLLSPDFVGSARALDISLIAVDEAHCISQWGQDFRPSYLKIPSFISRLSRRPPVAAFTATATPEVRSDVERSLGLKDPLRVITGFDRPNLRFDVMRPPKKYLALLDLLSRRRDKSGIIYCSTRKTVEKLCERLVTAGFPATRYHAGLEDSERRANQEDFIYDRRPLMVATNAFGMGIDKSNVSFVIHYNMPMSLEAYYQEAGRAGRDGERADCVLLYNAGDIRTARILINSDSENPELTEEDRLALIARDTERLERMIGYCETRGCYRGYILDYFGQPHNDTCGACGNCLVPYSERDVTRQAQMALSCVARIHDRLHYYVGETVVIRTLLGSRDKRILSLGLDSLSTYGILRGTDNAFMRALFAALRDQGFLAADPVHGSLRPTAKAREVLFHGMTVTVMDRSPAPEAKSSGRSKKPVPLPMDPEDMDERFNELLISLKILRSKLARQEGVPLYVIFSNATLTELARRRPRTLDELLAVPGVGTVKAGRFGKAVLDVIRASEK